MVSYLFIFLLCHIDNLSIDLSPRIRVGYSWAYDRDSLHAQIRVLEQADEVRLGGFMQRSGSGDTFPFPE